MALSDDQKAMLRLLARDQSYEDIAALMGLSVDEVVSRAQGSVAQLESEGIPAPALPDVPAAAVPPPPEPKPEKTPEPKEEPAEETPTQDLPTPAPKISAKPPAPAKGGSPRTGARLKLPEDRGARWGLAAGAGISLVLILLLVTGVLGGGEGNDSDSSSDARATATDSSGRIADASLDTKRVTGAILEPVDGGDATGRAVLGRDGQEPLLQVEAEGLDPTPRGQSYTVWLYSSPKLALRVGSVRVGDSGGLAAQFPLPVEVLQYIAAGAFKQIDLSLTSDAAYNAEVSAAKQQKRLPRYIGTSVLRGQIVGPLARFAKKQGG